jgi:adenylate kinase
VLNVVIFGAPGSGKGTQSAYIVQKYGLEHLSTGDLLRAEQVKQSELGKLIESYISQGALVPDQLIIDILANVLDERKSSTGYIFDGFPRTTEQAVALKKMLAERGMELSVMLDLAVPEDELIDRLLKRGISSGRSDDNFETIQKRIQVYHSKTAPVKAYFEKEGIAVDINGLGSLETIFGSIQSALDKLI